MRVKYFFCMLLLCLCMLFGMKIEYAYAEITFEDDNYVSGKVNDRISWEINGNTLTISGEGAMPDFRDETQMPWKEYMGGINKLIIQEGITSIGKYNFDGLNWLGSVQLPHSLVSIGEGAFLECSHLTIINLPDQLVEIKRMAFEGCSRLPNVVIPKSVQRIEEYAFAHCTRLTEVKVNAQLSEIPDSCFLMCQGLSGFVVPKSVKKIGEKAFFDAFRVSLIFEEGTERIEGELAEEVFKTQCFIPRSVTYIDGEAYERAGGDAALYGFSGSYAETFAAAKSKELGTPEYFYTNCIKPYYHPNENYDFLKVGMKTEADQLAENVDPEDEMEPDVDDSEESKTEGASKGDKGNSKNEEADKTGDLEDDEASSSKNKKEQQCIEVAKKTYALSYKALKKKAKKIELDVSSYEDQIRFQKISGNSKIKVSKAGVVTIPAKMKKGTYKIKIKICVDETKDYYGAQKNVVFTFKIK